MTETIFRKNVYEVYLEFLTHIPLANEEGAGFMTCTADSHQVAMKMFWLLFWGALMLSVFLYSQFVSQALCSVQSDEPRAVMFNLQGSL